MRPRTVPVRLKIWSPSPARQNLAVIECLQCGGALDWHQPDLGAPDRLLGICEHCGRWHLTGMMPGKDNDVLVLLPDTCQLQDALS